jgi:N-glycosylase/DNA lyase
MTRRINVSDFDLAATLECGQAFRWTRDADGWFTGIVGREVWRLRQEDGVLEWDCSREPARGQGAAHRTEPRAGSRLQHYLSLDRSLRDIVATFPNEPTLQAAVRRHWGLRVLRQEPWETLASFIASSTKQIVQIRQIVELLAQRFGEPIADGAFTFPTPAAIARASLPALLACKLGFRAKYLSAAARAVDTGKLDLTGLARMELPRAREELLKLHGVGEKIANCALLFGCGHDVAFPVDVWMQRALRRVKQRTDFGPHAGWAQQYLFYDERLSGGSRFRATA